MNATDSDPADALTRSVDLLINQVAHWQQNRWSASRADRVHDLVQRLADLTADAEGEPRRGVPRLADLVLPDQLRVISGDLVTQDVPGAVLSTAAEDVDAVRRSL